MKHKRIISGAAAVSLAGLVAVAGVASSADAKTWITGGDVKNHTLHGVDVAHSTLTGWNIKDQSITSADIAAGGVGHSEIRDRSITSTDISQHTIDFLKGQTGKTGAPGKQGAPGVKGDKGDKGSTGVGLQDAVYRVENYTNGGGGSATVACADDDATSQKYVAIAGGVQGSESGKTETQSGFLVSSSFPGRMDWNTGKPKAGRLDGWIVFGNSQHTDTLRVWALCVPVSGVSVQQVNLDN